MMTCMGGEGGWVMLVFWRFTFEASEACEYLGIYWYIHMYSSISSSSISSYANALTGGLTQGHIRDSQTNVYHCCRVHTRQRFTN